MINEMSNFNKLYNIYIANPKKITAMLIKNINFINTPEIYTILGVHYLTNEYYDEKLAKKYLILAVNSNNNSIACYNLAYLYETKLRRQFNKSTEEKMIKYYLLCIDMKIYLAYNQLARYLIQNPNIMISNLSAKKLLLEAANNNNIDALRNLVIVYEHNYKEKNKIMQYIYKLTLDVADLIDCVLDMLNNYDYINYCRFLHELGMDNIIDIFIFLKETPKLIINECYVCRNEKKCLKLNCKHIYCHQCLIELYISNISDCIVCRKKFC